MSTSDITTGSVSPPAAGPRILTDDAAQGVATPVPSVLFVDQSGQLGGAEFSMLPLTVSWSGAREVLLLSDGPFRRRLEAMGVRVHVALDQGVLDIRKEGVRLRWLKTLPGIVNQVRAIARHAEPFDLLFLNTQKALVLGALGKPLHRKRIVWHLHDIMSREHFGPLQRLMVRWITRLAVDHIVANSRASAASLVDLIGCEPDSIPVVHNGVNLEEFRPPENEDLRSLRRRFGLPEDAYLVGLFGRLAPWKGQHVAIEAIARVPDAHLVLVGSALFGEQRYAQSLHDLVDRLGVADRVHFAGFRDDMPAWMRAVDLILHSSTEAEPFGRVIVEGMAAGRPVIAAGAGGVVEIVRHRRNGWLVEPGNVAALADAIEVLRAAPELAQRLADQASIDVQRYFSVDDYLKKMKVAMLATMD